MGSELQKLQKSIQGEIHLDELHRRIYATDASSYRELPLGVALPKDEKDVVELVRFANDFKTPLIPRTAGTSLAGQVVGSGLIVDFGRHMTKILEVNEKEKWVRVQPGVVRDELNKHLKDLGLFFAPETSTANRAMIGGMFGNNSCGTNSIVYGSTRDHVLECKAVLSNGDVVSFTTKDQEEIKSLEKANHSYESTLYADTLKLLSEEGVKERIQEQYPKASVSRRNTGYGVDQLIQRKPFEPEGKDFSMIDLLAGSEGTLAMISELKLSLSPLPPSNKSLTCIHFDDLYQSLEATVTAMEMKPTACELMDHHVLERTRDNIQQRENRFFIQGEPKAILVVEFSEENNDLLSQKVKELESKLRSMNLGYHYPVVSGPDISRVWELRKAGLGLLSNIPGDLKPVPVIEDTAVDVRDLPAYIREFNALLEERGLYSVHYAHAGAGELHLRPILDLKTAEGQTMFREILKEVAILVKKYRGSLSGEHGDGRLRGEFIPLMVGEENYELLRKIKQLWDPKNILNPGKIVDTPPMDSSLRFERGQLTPAVQTYFDFSHNQGIVRATEQCNGSADCRKLAISGGTMCPSYMASRMEKDTTRARANALREFYTKKDPNPESVREALDLCLSCKGCKSECPSNVDMSKLKAEWEQQDHEKNGIKLSTRLVGMTPALFRFGMNFPWLANFFTQVPPFSIITKTLFGFSQKRNFPKLANQSLESWFQKNKPAEIKERKGRVVFLMDEFCNYLDVDQGKAAISLLWRLGYEVDSSGPLESGRTQLSKGLVKEAKKLIEENAKTLSEQVSKGAPLVGIEPSTLLGFRDEYPDLVEATLKENAKELAENSLLIDEFLAAEIKAGKLNGESFNEKNDNVLIHGHCHQKALSSTSHLKKVLSILPGTELKEIPSGCCGMAGSFGYSASKYKLSMQIGELVLFPWIRKKGSKEVVLAPGTSCRHQIKDGTGEKALHPVEYLLSRLA